MLVESSSQKSCKKSTTLLIQLLHKSLLQNTIININSFIIYSAYRAIHWMENHLKCNCGCTLMYLFTTIFHVTWRCFFSPPNTPVNLLLYSTVFVYIYPQYTYQQFIISFLAMKDHMKGVLVLNQRKGGSNLKDQNNFVCRKARRNADKTKSQYKCVKVDSIKCRATVWVNDETLMVEKSNHEHNHSPLLLEMLAMYALGLFSVQSLYPYFISTLVQYIQVLDLHTCRLVRLSAVLFALVCAYLVTCLHVFVPHSVYYFHLL